MLKAVQTDTPWAVSDFFFGIEEIVDEEGRPIAERRAPSAVKEGVAIELRPCPYKDERHGIDMNVSALAQITSHLPGVLADMACMRSSLAGHAPTWLDIYALIIDMLIAPGMQLLRTQGTRPISGKMAVGYKLAAGYFGVLRALLVHEAKGNAVPRDVPEFLAFIKERRSLIGASEACAGPPVMIVKTTTMLLHGDSTAEIIHDTARLAIARALATQLALGVVWELFDAAVEKEVLIGFPPGEPSPLSFSPRNVFMTRALKRRKAEMDTSDACIAHGSAALLSIPDVSQEDIEALKNAMSRYGDGTEIHGELSVLLAHGDGALDCASADMVVSRFAQYLRAYAAMIRTIVNIETTLRGHVDRALNLAAPIKLNGHMFPKSKALYWFESCFGHKIRYTIHPQVALELHNHHRRVRIEL